MNWTRWFDSPKTTLSERGRNNNMEVRSDNTSQNVTGCNGECNGSKMRKCLWLHMCNGVTAFWGVYPTNALRSRQRAFMNCVRQGPALFSTLNLSGGSLYWPL